MPEAIFLGKIAFDVRSGDGGPGPNRWSERCVEKVGAGVALSILPDPKTGVCAELVSRERFGFGTFTFVVDAPLSKFDPFDVLGLFLYPTPDVGGDETCEIDIELARWGRPDSPLGSSTIWPVTKSLKPTSKTFQVAQADGVTVHRFTWLPTEIEARSFLPNGDSLFAWRFAPTDFRDRIVQKPMRLHVNLWRFQGKPRDTPLRIVLRSVAWTPLRPGP